MKMILTAATNPAEYLDAVQGWQAAGVRALHDLVREAAPTLEPRLKWGHLVFFAGESPVLLIRAEPHRLLFGFWRGKRMRHIDARLSGTGKFELATLDLREDSPLARETALELVREAERLAG